MAVVTNKRSIMTLYSGLSDIYSHRVRIVLAEKGVAFEVINAQLPERLEDLREINPYASIPTLVDRDLVLYDSNIIMEYLDERFPHPPLMPVYPVARARTRLMIHRIDKDWGDLIRKIENPKTKEDVIEAAKKELRAYLIKLLPVFSSGSPFFMNEEFSLIDCCLTPILWRLAAWGIQLPAEAKPIVKYAQRMFARDSFQASLTEMEQELGHMVKKTEEAF
jgi:stringent starvation protein A